MLPERLQTDIAGVMEAIAEGRDLNAYLTSCIAHIKSLPAATIIRAAEEIRIAGRMYLRPAAEQGGMRWFQFARKTTRDVELAALKKHPLLSRLFVFHGDGRVREAALKSWNEPPDSPFEFIALTYRLNDWVEQVRAAAHESAGRHFPNTRADIIAQASFFLLVYIEHLGRWGEQERKILDAALYRGDVMQPLAQHLTQRPSGRVAKVFQQALRRPGLDHELPRLAHQAALPHVRAIALETLVMKRARWTVGYEYEWIDKHFGLKRRVPLFDHRPVDHELDIETLLAEGAKDTAVAVRKVVTRGLIDLRHELSPAMEPVARMLLKDKSATVRSRAEFYLKHLTGSKQ